MDPKEELTRLQERVRLLEDRIQGLRASRRILMNLIASQEREKRSRIARLETENARLQQQTSRMAKAVLDRNIRIVRLEATLRKEEQGAS